MTARTRGDFIVLPHWDIVNGLISQPFKLFEAMHELVIDLNPGNAEHQVR